MKALENLFSIELESSCTTTPQFKSVYTKSTNLIKKVLKENGCTDIKINRGHFTFSGFFTSPKGQIYYISVSDMRSNIREVLIRTAKSYTDYSGGSNNYLKVSNFEAELKKFID